MKETLFCQVVCDYPDYQDKAGVMHDGTECYDCETFNDLFEVLQKVLKENVLDHVHLDFCHHDNTNWSHGSIVLPLKNEHMHWYQNIVRESERLG